MKVKRILLLACTLCLSLALWGTKAEASSYTGFIPSYSNGTLTLNLSQISCEFTQEVLNRLMVQYPGTKTIVFQGRVVSGVGTCYRVSMLNYGFGSTYYYGVEFPCDVVFNNISIPPLIRQYNGGTQQFWYGFYVNGNLTYNLKDMEGVTEYNLGWSAQNSSQFKNTNGKAEYFPLEICSGNLKIDASGCSKAVIRAQVNRYVSVSLQSWNYSQLVTSQSNITAVALAAGGSIEIIGRYNTSFSGTGAGGILLYGSVYAGGDIKLVNVYYSGNGGYLQNTYYPAYNQSAYYSLETILKRDYRQYIKTGFGTAGWNGTHFYSNGSVHLVQAQGSVYIDNYIPGSQYAVYGPSSNQYGALFNLDETVASLTSGVYMDISGGSGSDYVQTPFFVYSGNNEYYLGSTSGVGILLPEASIKSVGGEMLKLMGQSGSSSWRTGWFTCTNSTSTAQNATRFDAQNKNLSPVMYQTKYTTRSSGLTIIGNRPLVTDGKPFYVTGGNLTINTTTSTPSNEKVYFRSAGTVIAQAGTGPTLVFDTGRNVKYAPTDETSNSMTTVIQYKGGACGIINVPNANAEFQTGSRFHGGTFGKNVVLNECEVTSTLTCNGTAKGTDVTGQNFVFNGPAEFVNSSIGTVTCNDTADFQGVVFKGGTFNKPSKLKGSSTTGNITFTQNSRGSTIDQGNFIGTPACNGSGYVTVTRGTFTDNSGQSTFIVHMDSESTTDQNGGQRVTTVKLSNPPVIIDWADFPGINLDLDLTAPT